jgi:hypothetical protein
MNMKKINKKSISNEIIGSGAGKNAQCGWAVFSSMGFGCGGYSSNMISSICGKRK